MRTRPAADQTGFLLQRAHRRLRQAHNEALRPLRLNIAHLAVVALLAEHGDLSQRRLIEIIGTRTGYNATDMKLKHARGVLEFGALEKPHSELTWQGRPHDFIGFDEGGQLSLDKVLYVTGWLRSVTLRYRSREQAEKDIEQWRTELDMMVIRLVVARVIKVY